MCGRCGMEMTLANYSLTALGLASTPYWCKNCIMKDWEKEQEQEDDNDVSLLRIDPVIRQQRYAQQSKQSYLLVILWETSVLSRSIIFAPEQSC